MLEEIFDLLREQRLLPTITNDAANRPCAAGDPVSTWAVDRTAQKIFPPVVFPTTESEHYPAVRVSGGPASRGKQATCIYETSHRAKARDPADSLLPNGNLNIDPVRCRSLSNREVPERLIVRLGSLGDQGNLRSDSGLSQTGEPFDQSETAAGGFGIRGPIPGVSGWEPVNVRSNGRFDSRTHRTQLHHNPGALNLCVHPLHDMGLCFTARKQPAAGITSVHPANQRHFIQGLDTFRCQ